MILDGKLFPRGLVALPEGAAASEDPVLSVQDLHVSFRKDNGWKNIVRDISFDVGPGETVTIVGESGSGKSVSSLAIMGLLPRKSTLIQGRVQLSGEELTGKSHAEMSRIRGREMAMIFQDPLTSLNPLLTIGEQIGETLTRHLGYSRAEARSETIRLLEKVRIPNASTRLDYYPHHFSGGMRQRAMIAMAIATRPKLLIADEPTTALDVTIQGQILALLKQLQQEEGMAMLFVTHDMGVVAEIADRTVVMFRGDVVESGPTAEIFNNSRHVYTRALLSAIPKLGSMENRDLPARFDMADPVTGLPQASEPVKDTVRPNQPVLEVKKLRVQFDIRKGFLNRKTGAVHAVEDVSFKLLEGETLALVGESGCGKSTTGRAITRLLEPKARQISVDGDVFVNGFDVMNLDLPGLKRMRRSIQMVFQDPLSSLNPRRSIGALLTTPFVDHKLGTRSQATDKAADLLKKVGLGPEVMQRYPGEFSGGQRQRICIARALMLDPSIIIADEAVSALDVSIKAQVCNLLLDLQQSMNVAFLFISHDMAVVERISHRVAVMYLGEIVEIGPRAAIFGNPQHEYTRKLLAAVPVPDPAQKGIIRKLSEDEIKSPVRANGYIAPQRSYRQVGPDHFVIQ